MISYSAILFISAGITLAICYALLYTTGQSSYNTAYSTIVNDNQNNCLIFAQEAAGAISQQLKIIGQSACLEGALYSQRLMSAAKDTNTTMKAFPSYREYNFVAGCTPPACPADYSKFGSSSRIPIQSNYTSGSLSYSSVYLYSTQTGSSVRSDSAWNKTVAFSPDVPQIINALAYADLDMKTAYFHGSNATIFYYLSASLSTSGSGYTAVHRTFPGVNKASQQYDPTTRPWFAKSATNNIYLYGPYIETFTRQPVINLSSRQTAKSQTGKSVTLVSAAVVLVSTLTDIVGRVHYTNGGFGALVGAKQPYTVFAWGNRSDTYNTATKSFDTLATLAPQIATRDLSVQSTFDYTDTSGVQYIVAAVPFFPYSDSTGATYNSGMVMLVFSRRSLVLAPLSSLQSNIDTTTSAVVTKTIIVVAILVAAVLLIEWLVVWHITAPLEGMRSVSADIVRISAEEEESKDYSEPVHKAFATPVRSDELGALAVEYSRVVCLLHNRTIEKQETPKYPLNPFHMPIAFDRVLSWPMIASYMQKKTSTTPMSPTGASDTSQPMELPSNAVSSTGELDVLSSFQTPASRNVKRIEVKEKANTASTSPAIDSANSGPVAIPVRDEAHQLKKLPSSLSAVPWWTSLKAKLHMVNLLLLAGLVIVMILTIIQLRTDGSAWMQATGADLQSTEMANIASIAVLKAAFVQAYFQQMTTDVLIGAAFASQMLNHNLTVSPLRPGRFLNSYARDSMDPYSYSGATTSIPGTATASYFYPVSECDRGGGRRL